MINPVLILTRNCLDLTKRCVDSVKAQDVPTQIHLFDNGSSDGTMEWARSKLCSPRTINYLSSHIEGNIGVSRGWNALLEDVFEESDAEHALVIGNDTILAPWTYSALLSTKLGFVTGVDVGMSPLPGKPDIYPLAPHPDFSCFLISRACWERVGPFDERFVHYCGDTDYHVRAHRLGAQLYKASVPYNHERSSTMNRATPQERHAIQEQANKDRDVFRRIYGCLPGTKEYNDLFREPSGQTQA